MSGVELRGRALVIERSPNELKDLALAFSGSLTRLGIGLVFIAGYVAILTGRALATEDIDVLIEERPASKIDQLIEVLTNAGYWAPTMPPESLHENHTAGTNS